MRKRQSLDPDPPKTFPLHPPPELLRNILASAHPNLQPQHNFSLLTLVAPARSAQIPAMINFTICLGFLFTPDAPAIPEPICAANWRRIDAHYQQLTRQRDTFGAGAHLEQELQLTRRWRDLWFATWWINWPNARPEDLQIWLPIYRQRLAEWLEN
jgi:hypothetical protein